MDNEFEYFKETWQEKIAQIKKSGPIEHTAKESIKCHYRIERRKIERHMTEEELIKKQAELNGLYSDLEVSFALSKTKGKGSPDQLKKVTEYCIGNKTIFIKKEKTSPIPNKTEEELRSFLEIPAKNPLVKLTRNSTKIQTFQKEKMNKPKRTKKPWA